MSGLPWQTPYWGGCDKHYPVLDGTPWLQIRAGTNKGRKVAKYHESMTDDDIEDLEMSFVEPDDLIWQEKCIRYYYARSSTHPIVGASRGEETTYILIVRQQIGHVHGYPETRDALFRYMRKYNPQQLSRFLERFPS